MKRGDIDWKSNSENDLLEMMNDTSKLVGKLRADQLSSAAIAAQTSNSLTNEVEFWKWMGRNYSKSGIFDTNQTMQQYISQGIGKEEWLAKQLQGKGYEWDWMKVQQRNIKNIFKTYDAGDVANRAASDVTEKNLLTGKIKEYQMKAYTSKTNPDLHNTPKDMTIVTNSEKVDVVKSNGYDDIQEFKDAQSINKSTNERLEKIKDGKVNTSYNIKNVAGKMGKAGIVGCVIGMGSEAIVSYKSWKEGQLTDEEYLKEILKAGGDIGITSALTAGVMIPVASSIAVAGVSTLLTIPVAFIISDMVNNVVSPCFGRGKYREILSSAKYYQNIESIYDDLLISMEHASNQYYDFVINMSEQNKINESLKKRSMDINKDLKDLYDSI